MAKGWAKFPYADGKYVYTGATLKKAWNRLHLGDQEPLPKDAAVVDAWIAFHAGEFERAAKAGLAAGGAGITAANKATAIYANYLEDDEKRKLALFEDVARNTAINFVRLASDGFYGKDAKGDGKQKFIFVQKID